MNEFGHASRATIARNTDDASTVTVGEMRVAVAAVILDATEGETAEGARDLADEVLAYIVNHRERRWRPGDVVRTPKGVIWQRVNEFQWRKMGAAGVHPHSKPERPLTLIYSPKDEADERRRERAMERARDEGAEF